MHAYIRCMRTGREHGKKKTKDYVCFQGLLQKPLSPLTFGDWFVSTYVLFMNMHNLNVRRVWHCWWVEHGRTRSSYKPTFSGLFGVFEANL